MDSLWATTVTASSERGSALKARWLRRAHLPRGNVAGLFQHIGYSQIGSDRGVGNAKTEYTHTCHLRRCDDRSTGDLIDSAGRGEPV